VSSALAARRGPAFSISRPIPPTQRGTVFKRRTNESGQAVVEFAVILPVLLMILFAILQFGIVFNNYIQVTAAAREGARKAAVSRSLGTAAAETAATTAAKAAAPGLKQTSITVTYPNSPTFAQGSDVTVQVTYPYSISILGIIVKSGKLTSSTTMRVE
jgi:Flp pilus assembly protein TadG